MEKHKMMTSAISVNDAIEQLKEHEGNFCQRFAVINHSGSIFEISARYDTGLIWYAHIPVYDINGEIVAHSNGFACHDKTLSTFYIHPLDGFGDLPVDKFHDIITNTDFRKEWYHEKNETREYVKTISIKQFSML